MDIGPYRLASKLIAAPMAGVTDRPFRQLCRRLGAGLAVSEMVSADSTLWASRKTQHRIDHRDEQAPVAVQIMGADPSRMAEAARRNADYGAQIIDINMGCPAKKVCRVAAGSALLQDEALVGRILEAVVAAVDIPVTLKIRTGRDPEHRNGLAIARIAEQSGIQALAVHGRTRACGFSGQAEYDTIRDIKHGVSIPVIANGDIATPEQARRVLEYTAADALMIGRAAQGRPWIFGEIEHFLRTGRPLAEPGLIWVRNLLLEHLENLYDHYGDYQGVRMARKHIAWYSRGQSGGSAFRRDVNAAETTQQQRNLVQAFFARLESQENLAA